MGPPGSDQGGCRLIQTGAVFAGGSLWRCLRLAFSALIHRCRQPLASAVHTNRHSDARAAQHDRGLSLTQAVPATSKTASRSNSVNLESACAISWRSAS